VDLISLIVGGGNYKIDRLDIPMIPMSQQGIKDDGGVT